MAIDLETLEVNIPSINFGEYTTLLSGPPKSGKTEFCTEYDKSLILDFEQGSKGKVVYRVPIQKWIEVKQLVRQLITNEQLKLKYNTICFDTMNYAFPALKKYAINLYQQEHTDKDITSFNKIPYGGGWQILEEEIKDVINSLKRVGYGIVLVAHIKEKTFNRNTSGEYEKTVPDLSDRERNIISAMADFLLLAKFETEIIEPAVLDGEKVIKDAIVKTNRVLYLRTNENVEAGFRWKNVPEKIPFQIEALKKVFTNAVLEEIETGKKKYELTDEKTEKINEKFRKENELRQQQEFKEQRKQEEEHKLEEIKKEIIDTANNKFKEGITKEVINKAFAGDPKQLTSLDEANAMLERVKNLIKEQ